MYIALHDYKLLHFPLKFKTRDHFAKPTESNAINCAETKRYINNNYGFFFFAEKKQVL